MDPSFSAAFFSDKKRKKPAYTSPVSDQNQTATVATVVNASPMKPIEPPPPRERGKEGEGVTKALKK